MNACQLVTSRINISEKCQNSGIKTLVNGKGKALLFGCSSEQFSAATV